MPKRFSLGLVELAIASLLVYLSGVALPSEPQMILDSFSVVALVVLFSVGLALLMAVIRRSSKRTPSAPNSWKQYRFGFSIYALIFLAFDMEMIFMYPWAVVFAELGMPAFLDMLVFIGLLSAGVAYSWGMGGLQWE